MAEDDTHTESSIFTIPNPSINLQLVNPANQINAVKLNDENFLLWQLQILSGIRGLGLDYLLHEDTPIPPRVLEIGESTPVSNPLFVTWSRQDQLLFSFLLASMTECVQSQMIGCATAAQLWMRVTRLFASRSKARVMQFKLQLQTLKKGGQSMKDYLSKMKKHVDMLAACGHPISEEDPVLYILGGVGVEYESVVVHITSRSEFLSPADASALLLAHEGRIESYNVTTDNMLPTVHATTLSHSKNRENSYQNRENSYQHFNRGRGRGRSFRGGRKAWTIIMLVLNVKFVAILTILQRNVFIDLTKTLFHSTDLLDSHSLLIGTISSLPLLL